MRTLKFTLLPFFAIYLVACVSPTNNSPIPTIPAPSGLPSPTAGIPTPPTPSGSSGSEGDEDEQSEESTSSSGSGTPPPTGSGLPGLPDEGSPGFPGEDESTADAGDSEEPDGSGTGNSEEASDTPVWETSDASSGGETGGDAASGGSVFTDADLEDLERTLDEALGTFDSDILREQENARTKTGNVGSTGGQSEVEVFAGVGEFERAGGSLEEGDETQSGQSSGPLFNDGPPPSSNDDVVARQIREAAEREPDPEQRRILWEEYERYKGDR